MQSPKAAGHPSCLRCGYDLRGLPPDSACPECGLAVSFSLAPPTTLSAAPPSWARTLAIGAALLFLSALAIPAASQIMEALYPVNPHTPPAEVMRRIYLRQAAVAAAFAFHALAVWVITTREPRTPRLSRRQIGIWVARLCALGPPIGLLWLLYRQVFNAWSRHPPYLPLLFLCLYFPVPALVFLHLRRLAARIGRPRLAEHAGIVGTGLSISLTAATLLGLISSLTEWDYHHLLPLLMILPFACIILGFF